jgi:hypothetical protein
MKANTTVLVEKMVIRCQPPVVLVLLISTNCTDLHFFPFQHFYGGIWLGYKAYFIMNLSTLLLAAFGRPEAARFP